MEEKTVIYTRLSRDDEKTAESESIINQKAFLRQYAKENGMTVICEIADDGISGTTFLREGFQKLLTMIEAGEVHTVLTKDLSRLGRDYIQTGYYLEQYFPLHRVRYIAVNDGIDTSLDDGGNDLSPFRAVFNDLYAKDISKKVRTALAAKKRNGQFIGSSAPFGYQKDPQNKNKLMVEPETAFYVKEIFSAFIAGCSPAAIGRLLTEQGVKTPSAYKGQKGADAWNSGMVRRILSNPTYAGHLTQNMSRKINYKINRKIRLPKAEWITVKNTHEPIVSEAVFQTAAELLAVSGYKKTKRQGSPHLLSGLVFCRDCGSVMSFIREAEERTYLVCSTWRKQGKKSGCHSHCIRESLVEAFVKEAVKSRNLQTKTVGDIAGMMATLHTNFSPEQKERNLLIQSVEKIYISAEKEIEIIYRSAGFLKE